MWLNDWRLPLKGVEVWSAAVTILVVGRMRSVGDVGDAIQVVEVKWMCGHEVETRARMPRTVGRRTMLVGLAIMSDLNNLSMVTRALQE